LFLVDTDLNYEKPEIKPHSEERPEAMPLKLTITVSDLQPGVEYVVYRYDDEEKVPTANFNANKSAAVSTVPFTATVSTYNRFASIMSDEKVLFRAVRADAS